MYTSCVRAAFAGPYVAIVRELGFCPECDNDEDFKIEGALRSNRSSKANLFFNGNVTVKNDIFSPGATTVTIDVAKWDTVSGWREHFLVMPIGDLCSAMQDIGKDLVEVVVKHVKGFPPKCPVPNTIYNVTNTPARIGQLRHFPVLPYGRFRAHVLNFHAKRPGVKRPRGCTKIIADVSQTFARPTT
ncbi:uncharacterized protein LOC117647820 [Thrips palmi]|uniref:Uncharacterized protein LOC117647820 n=1 Tax=Thrips palmi TaxID=161013 RepID=A0A6P8ZQD8_THRPL|nr:uncharacterized protein LOC117647820 [Thrips palmi]